MSTRMKSMSYKLNNLIETITEKVLEQDSDSVITMTPSIQTAKLPFNPIATLIFKQFNRNYVGIRKQND